MSDSTLPAEPEEATLRSIHLPTDIDGWPPAPGWWALLGVVLVLLLLGGWLWRRYRRQAFRREALVLLQQIESQQQSASTPPLQTLDALSSLLKRVAMTAHGREEVAGRSGDRWLQFLDQTGNTHGFTQGPGRALGASRFQAEQTFDATALISLCREWIQKQRC